MDESVLNLYRQLAARAANCLPEAIDPTLLHAWCALTRTDSVSAFPLETFIERQQHFWVEVKRKVEAAEQIGRIDADIDRNFIPNISCLLLKNPGMTLAAAVDEYARCIAARIPAVADDGQLIAASRRMGEVLREWLQHIGIYVSARPPVNIPASTLDRLLSNNKGRPDIHFAPNIPPDKLANALLTCAMPDHDNAAMLIDCTFWGSSKDAVVFGSRGIYFNNLEIFGFLPYCDFPHVTFAPVPGKEEVSFGTGKITLSGSQVAAAQVVDMLDILRKEVRRLQTRVEAKPEGIASIPGMHSLKQMLAEEVIEPLRDPEKFRKYKIEIPNGILLFGPPGCGKTFVAKKLADELNREFIEVSPAAVGSPYIHETGLKIAGLFERAARSAPSVMFVDEFEGLVPSRFSLRGEDQYKAEEVNEWLVQIGTCAERRILFVAATNHPWKLDEAVRRSGRLDKKVYVGPPDILAITEMLRFHLDGRPVSPQLSIDSFAEAIAGQGYSASDLKLLVDEAAKIAMRHGGDVGYEHLEAAAAQKVRPSITDDVQAEYQLFMEKAASA